MTAESSEERAGDGKTTQIRREPGHREIKRLAKNIRKVASDRDLGNDGESSKNNGSFFYRARILDPRNPAVITLRDHSVGTTSRWTQWVQRIRSRAIGRRIFLRIRGTAVAGNTKINAPAISGLCN